MRREGRTPQQKRRQSLGLARARPFEGWQAKPSRKAGFGHLPSGQSLVIVALSFIGILAFVGLAIDASVLYLNRVWMGEAADAAALAGAIELPSENAACARAVEYLENNGYTSQAGFSYQIVFPEESEVANFPTLPSEPSRVLNSPDINTCRLLNIPGDHYYIWISGTQSVQTVLMNLVGITQVSTGVPAVAKMPNRFAVAFSIDHSESMRSDTCIFDSDAYHLYDGPDFLGVSYACTSHVTGCTPITLQNPGFENGLSGWSHAAHVNPEDLPHSGDKSLAMTNQYTGNIKIAQAYQVVDTSAENLYVAFWIRLPIPGLNKPTPESDDKFALQLEWDRNGDGAVDLPAHPEDVAWGMYPPIVQFCENGKECRFCPDQFQTQPSGSLDPLRCNAIFSFKSLDPGWAYVVAEVPSEAWRSGHLAIGFRNLSDKDGSRDGSQDTYYIDDVQLWSCPWEQGPWARYFTGPSSNGTPNCMSQSYAPNCDYTFQGTSGIWSSPPAYGSQYYPPDRLFPDRRVLQQPLYSVLLAVGKEEAAGEPASMLELLGPGHSVGFTTYRQNSALNTLDEFQTLTTDYALFRQQLFGSMTAFHAGNGDTGNNLAGGIAAGRSILAAASPERAPVLIIFSGGQMDTDCGHSGTTYCSGQTHCAELSSGSARQACLNTAWANVLTQVQHAVSQGITIYTIGVGPSDTWTMQLDIDGNPATLETVKTLEEIARLTGGQAYYATQGSALVQIMQDIYDDMQGVVFLTR